MGMGGANVAVGGESSSLFYNPAGLSALKKSEGLEVEIINLTGTVSENTISLMDEMDAATTDQATFDVLEKYQGSNNHLTVQDYSSLAYRGDSIAWSIGILAGTQLNMVTHALGSASGLLEVQGYVLGGAILGMSYDWNDKLSVGLGAKILQGSGGKVAIPLSDLVSDNLSDSLDDQFEDFDATTFDIGAMYDLKDIIPFGDYWKPTVGLSILNIGETKLGNYGTIPMTVNLGYSVRPDFPLLSDWLFTIDYIDLLDAFDDEYDADMAKRWRIGAQASLFNNSWVQMTGRVGMYNAAPTFGAEFRFTLVTLVYSTYAEEIGAYAGQEEDRRHTFSLAIGW